MAMTATPTIPTKGLCFSRKTAPVFWMVNILWVLKSDGNGTNSACSVLEQWMRCGSGVPISNDISGLKWKLFKSG